MKLSVAIMALIALFGVVVGCAKSTQQSCAPVENGVGVCIDGKPITWSAAVKPPHMHEQGGYYAPVEDLATHLKVNPVVGSNRKSVLIAGKVVMARSEEAVGVHMHEDFVYVPIREFAEAAGFKVMVDTKAHTVNIQR